MDEPQTPPEISIPLTSWENSPAPELKHSGPGIASFVLSVLVGLSLLLLILAIGVLAIQSPESLDEESGAAMLIAVGLAVLGLAFANAVALALGIIGLCQKDRKKVFAILGVVVSALLFLGTGGLMLLGSLA